MRTGEPVDAPAIARLVNHAFRPERFFSDADRTNPEKVAALLEQGKFLLRFEGGVLAGCVYTEIRGARGYFGSRKHRHSGHLSNGRSRQPCPDVTDENPVGEDRRRS